MLGESKRVIWALLLLTGCGGAQSAAEAPERAEPEAVLPASSSAKEEQSDDTAQDDATDSSAPSSSAASTVDPQFTPDMSVEQAIAAVPRGEERRDIDAETLAKPLQDLELYASCKPGAAKVKLRVAVWLGKAVGVDVTTAPKKAALADCIQGKIRELTWEKKVRSLNTIEYQF
ncbi:MAG TPA: hypothetical protein VER33_15875 [Polyangiaceae bacterium]|nr:hypothetical protein [Polyangiaceae bacterium]